MGKLTPGKMYHIYNCANGVENLFREKDNYFYFTKKYFLYTTPVADTYAFCLLKNHFHAMIRINDEEKLLPLLKQPPSKNPELDIEKLLIHRFKNLFISYAKAFNKFYGRRGSLFNPNLKKKEVKDDSYFRNLVLYIHNNPVKHGFVENMYDWKYSSIHAYVSSSSSTTTTLNNQSFQNFGYFDNFSCFEKQLTTVPVLDWFGGREKFIRAHEDVGDIRSVFE